MSDRSRRPDQDDLWDADEDGEIDYLRGIIGVFKEAGIRTSIFVDADTEMVSGAKETGTDRIELYTESYARLYEKRKGKNNHSIS